MKKMLNEGNQIHNFISISGSRTKINYSSGSNFLTSYGSGSTGQKVTIPTVPVPVTVPVPQHLYILLQSHIAEGDKAGTADMLLIPANIADMTQVLPKSEGRRWKEEQGRIQLLDNANSFSNFLDHRLEYGTEQIAHSERLVLPKLIPLQSQVTLFGTPPIRELPPEF
jgi:hypothetical protein